MHDIGSFDRLASLYDRAMPPARAGPLRDGLALARRQVHRVVDLGGGPGRAVRSLGVDRPLVVDAAPGMVRRASAREVPGLVADAARLPLRTASVDAVLIVDALHHMPDWQAVVDEVAGVLRPGGVLVIREFDPETLRGRALVRAERILGFDSSFAGPDELASRIAAAGLSPTVLDRGFGYTVAGVKSGTEK